MKKPYRKIKKSKATKPEKSYPVGDWMDESLKPIASKMSLLERFAVADKLEHRASQLRDMKKEIKVAEYVALGVRPKAKDAIIYFAKKHCRSDKTDDEHLKSGVQWIIDTALTMLPDLFDKTNVMVRSRDREGLSDSELNESWTSQSLAAMKAKIAKQNDEDED